MSRFFLLAFLFFGSSLCGMRPKNIGTLKRSITSKKRKSGSNLLKKKRSSRRKRKYKRRDNSIVPKKLVAKRTSRQSRKKNRITTLPIGNSRRIPVRPATRLREEIEKYSSEEEESLKRPTLHEKRKKIHKR